MKKIKRMFKSINIKDFKLYLCCSILLILLLLSFGKFDFTKARYESNVSVNASPNLAFFIVDVTNTSKQLRLDGLVPRTEPYTFTFNVSNFNEKKHANVDLKYSIEIITTTNLPLNFKIFKGNNMEQNKIDSDTVTTDDNGVYYRHLVINDVNVMNYNEDSTDTYVLWVEFPSNKMDYPDYYAGIIDLVDIKIDAEQVV